MTENKQITNVFIISDSVGDTGDQVARAAAAQFLDAHLRFSRYPFTQTISLLDSILKKAEREKAMIFSTFVDPKLNQRTKTFCQEKNLKYFDVLTPAIQLFAEETGLTSSNTPGRRHSLNENYFDKISAMEFAVTYDDGKDPAGFLKADIVLLGVSRTSKTPLSLYLANKGYKVANLPLVPKTQIPEEIWQVDRDKIFGLTTTKEVLNGIRRQRMISYGLNPDSSYADMDSINKELQFADDLFKKIGCLVINTANKSIEETATIIMESLD
ncbi:pyruvate, phosphate dikinase/phosphoenolpyruvate synthase regulator [Pediococcus acidilactici]|uniref:pyruvate, water dikinase regulatory protein n=1 Tax=Pediococcus acidilactici TaxID=1254 RepID=UPI00132B43BE|nr:pyruvate, water dikinase regulatory protein [Pediococcus acidilactici]KAF0465140.1 pyruvate, phosphate dikinase/phosphoenolpyruvate synthase regulator [Pediococcus acidilactici]KAF0472002.1 pyruvate, phosphate dikinase/phosphoenolpyruvate synthase regulator [Pediococcus acidilactici]KAF0490626.1 pyruvate, phosphate dikinase/phosphoenolpyruvate synthase regulator [Pediococcus acidilactici]KAF0525375.1 pyruvate, phosphate dikinase/phosphoenolpyruvate synthase regulator [Pediococcus acidilactic